VLFENVRLQRSSPTLSCLYLKNSDRAMFTEFSITTCASDMLNSLSAIDHDLRKRFLSRNLALHLLTGRSGSSR